MENAAFNARYTAYRQAVEGFLDGLFTESAPWGDLYEAMRYSLLSGGKRIRPVLTLEFARLAGLGEGWTAALPPACALELVHTYSLIHDDLPCMDDDALRRGRPTNHRVYGETLAVLAGDALQPEAYRLILTAPELDQARRADCALVLARASGAPGMVGGQVLDTLHAPKTEEELTRVHLLKTGAMIRGACLLGCVAAAGSPALQTAAGTYAEHLGLAFQIRDDLLDVVGSPEVFGKPIGSDQEEGKVTFADLLGPEGCAAAVERHTEAAKAALAFLGGEGAFLRALADSLARRER